ncbi:MAG TPA: sugar phosphate isomerase/epimerase family protein [Gemmataceae bacterium]|nr:sugar phosphate isomerase/epimerase family protein [Gemmataceae bacterium]
MRYVYFTKSLDKLDLAALIAFCKDAGLDGADLAVRPGHPVTPDNAATELPKAARAFKDAGLTIGLVSTPTSLNDADVADSKTIFEACARAEVPAVKVGYFPYQGKFDAALAEGRRRMAGFAKLAEKTGVKACYHTHSGNMLGNNAAGLRLLLHDLDPHHVGAFLDTGHTAVNGGPIRYELDLVRQWLSLVSIKDMLWEKKKDVWEHHVVPAGEGIVRWADVAKGLEEVRFGGTISLHGEYEAKDLDQRKELAKTELAFLKKHFGTR